MTIPQTDPRDAATGRGDASQPISEAARELLDLAFCNGWHAAMDEVFKRNCPVMLATSMEYWNPIRERELRLRHPRQAFTMVPVGQDRTITLPEAQIDDKGRIILTKSTRKDTP